MTVDNLRNPPWTEEQREYVVTRIRNGDSPEEVMRALNAAFQTDRTQGAVSRQYYKATRKERGVKSRRPNREGVLWGSPEIQTLKDLRNKGWSYARIGRKMKRSKSAIGCAVMRYVNKTSRSHKGVKEVVRSPVRIPPQPPPQPPVHQLVKKVPCKIGEVEFVATPKIARMMLVIASEI